MSGRDFVAVVRLYVKDDKGEPTVVVANVGETCERVPAASLEWLERGGKIRRTAADKASALPADELPNYPRGRRMKPSEGA